MRIRTQNRPLTALTLATAIISMPAWAADLTVSIGSITSSDGKLMINLVRSEEEMKDGSDALASVMIQPRTEGVSLTLHDVPAGTYGIQMFHDENGNNELDANMIGIPKEPWAFSNNAAGRFGPPKWADIKFEISDEDKTVAQDISLNH